MTHRHDAHSHALNSLKHPYYARVERPMLTQLREPAPDPAPRPCSGRILKPHGAGDNVSLVNYFAMHEAQDVADDAAVNARLRAARRDVRVYGSELRDPEPIEVTEHERVGHAAPQRRWKWKTPTTKGSGRYKIYSAK